jgi:hypothetical protein
MRNFDRRDDHGRGKAEDLQGRSRKARRSEIHQVEKAEVAFGSHRHQQSS